MTVIKSLKVKNGYPHRIHRNKKGRKDIRKKWLRLKVKQKKDLIDKKQKKYDKDNDVSVR